MKHDFGDSVVLVTGAASGIGRETAKAFGGAGAKIVALDLDAAGAEHTALEIREAGGEAIFREADITDWDAVRASVETTVQEFGRIDVLFNCAGIEGPLAEIQDTDISTWRRVVDISLFGTFLGMKAVIPQMRAQGKGNIVNMASCAGIRGVARVTAYTSAKAGVIASTKTAALENAGHGIRVNCVCPGGVRTPLMENGRLAAGPAAEAQAISRHPLMRLGQPSEIAAAVLWLASDDASFVTGVALSVDGGFVI